MVDVGGYRCVPVQTVKEYSINKHVSYSSVSDNAVRAERCVGLGHETVCVFNGTLNRARNTHSILLDSGDNKYFTQSIMSLRVLISHKNLTSHGYPVPAWHTQVTKAYKQTLC